MKFLILCLCLFAQISFADISPEIKTKENLKVLSAVEQLLNSINTMESRFVQYDSLDETHLLDGQFYLSRPNRMRLIYNPPVQLEFIADGKSLIYVDKTFDQVTHIPLSETPASILLKQDFSFDDPDFLVTDVRAILDDYEITAIHKKNPTLGSITLIVTKEPITLRQWDIVDAQGVKTSVSLYQNQYNLPVDEKLFKFKDPRLKKRMGDLNRRGK